MARPSRTSVITNVTRGTVLAESAETARNPWTRLVGLMGRAHLPTGSALIFPGEKGIHMFFMRFPIDAIFYGREMAVLVVLEDLRPWRMTRYYFRARGVIELPAGTARATGTQPGDI